MRAARRGWARQTPARVAASAPASRALSMKVRSVGPARSSGAILVMCRASIAPACGSAPTRAAMSPAVIPGGRLKNSGSVMPRSIAAEGASAYPCGACRRRGLELRAAAETDGLQLVALVAAGQRDRVAVFLQESLGVIEP